MRATLTLLALLTACSGGYVPTYRDGGGAVGDTGPLLGPPFVCGLAQTNTARVTWDLANECDFPPTLAIATYADGTPRAAYSAQAGGVIFGGECEIGEAPSADCSTWTVNVTCGGERSLQIHGAWSRADGSWRSTDLAVTLTDGASQCHARSSRAELVRP